LRPQILQTKRGSISLNMTSSGQRSAINSFEWLHRKSTINQHGRNAGPSHFAEGDLSGTELGLIRRCEEGIQRAKRKGTKFGRPQALDDGERRMIADRYAKRATIVEPAEEYEVGAGTIWRTLNSFFEASTSV
jgi:hypothetical protein